MPSGKNLELSYLKQFDLKVFFGCMAVFGSAFFFYLATVVVKWSKTAGLSIEPSFFVFSRFLAGFLSVLILLGVQKRKIKIIRLDYLLGRTIANCVAVYCFFKGVTLTSVAEANILNMTYPLFIAVFSWLFLKEQRDGIAVGIVIAAFAGVMLILSPGQIGLKIESIWGLASGISAAIAIIYLNLSRRIHDTLTTLFFLFGLGLVIMAAVFFRQLYIPDFLTLKYLLLCAFYSVSGQFLITIGFQYVTAIEGGIISSTRILLAAILGPFIAADPVLTPYGWIGAALIFFGNVFLTVRKTKI